MNSRVVTVSWLRDLSHAFAAAVTAHRPRWHIRGVQGGPPAMAALVAGAGYTIRVELSGGSALSVPTVRVL
jgi:hypothetical protein